MNSHEFEIYLELYKRKKYNLIPIGKYPDGNYFYMTKKQIKTLELLNDNSTTHVGYGGSARSGKSVIECTAIIFDCHVYDDIAWGLARRELTTLKRTVLITLFNQLAFYGITDLKTNKDAKYTFNYNQQLNKLTFGNMSDVFLIDTAFKPSDPLNTRFGGFELTRSAIDESNETQLSVVNKLFERTGWRNNDKYGIKRKQFECFNPDKNHVYSRYWLPFRDNNEDEYKRFIRALPTDNPNPAVKEWVDDIIRTGDTATVERQIHGNFDFDDDPAKLCDYDAICDMFTNDHVIEGDKRISSDLAMQGRDRFVSGSWNGLICTIDIDKKKATGREIELDLKEQKTNRGVGNSNIIADSDGLGSYLESYIKNIKTFHGGSSSIRKNEFGNIKDECAFKLAEVINNRLVRVICTTEQEENIKKEISICLKQDNVYADKKKLIKKDKMKELLGHSPDYMDMLIMGMWFHLNKNKTIYDFEIKSEQIKIKQKEAFTFIRLNEFAAIATCVLQDNVLNLVDYKTCGNNYDEIESNLNTEFNHKLIAESSKTNINTINSFRDKYEVFGAWLEPNETQRMSSYKNHIKNRFNINIENSDELKHKFYKCETDSKNDIELPSCISGLFAHLEKHYGIFNNI